VAADVDALVVLGILLLKDEVTSPLAIAAVAILASGGSGHEVGTAETLGELLTEVLPRPASELPLLRVPTFLRLPGVPLPDGM